MIFVMMGTEVHPFDRLARAVDELRRTGATTDDVFVQLGSCRYEPTSATFERLLSFGDVCERVRSASVVVTHAGAGSTLVCIQLGRHPVVVPRRASRGEHVDEHQIPFAERLQAAGLATVVHEMDELPAAIAAARGRRAPEGAMRASGLTAWLDRFWSDLARRNAR